MSLKSIFTSFALLLSSMMFTSCYQEIDSTVKDNKTEVKVTLSGFSTSLSSGNTRATLEETSVKRISFSVFDKEGSEIEQITQSITDSYFGQITLLLPGGEYTFVAVAHGVSSDAVGNATIHSASEVQLPEALVPDTYSGVETFTISGNKSESFSMELNQAVAHVVAMSEDIVPETVGYIGFQIFNTEGSGEAVSAKNLPLFDPSTGLSLRDYKYNVALSTTSGSEFNREFNILLTSEIAQLPITISVYDSGSQLIAEYTRQLQPQPFRQSYTTTLSGTIFSSLQNGSFTFNGYLGDLTGTLENF